MKKIISIIILLSTVACIPATSKSSPSSLSNVASLFGESRNPLNKINFIDTGAFDTELSNSMTASVSTITVTTLSPVTVNQMPDRLGKWLAAIREKGGNVDIEPKTKSVASVLGMLFSILSDYAPLILGNQQTNSYEAASSYNAQIFYKPNSGEIKKIQFTKK